MGLRPGLSGNLMVTADGGQTWQAQELLGQAGDYVIRVYVVEKTVGCRTRWPHVRQT